MLMMCRMKDGAFAAKQALQYPAAVADASRRSIGRRLLAKRRLSCSVDQNCKAPAGISCYTNDPPVKLLTQIDLDTKAWVQFWTHRSGSVGTDSGMLKSVTALFSPNTKSYHG
jgi:hypothetical protein